MYLLNDLNIQNLPTNKDLIGQYLFNTFCIACCITTPLEQKDAKHTWKLFNERKTDIFFNIPMFPLSIMNYSFDYPSTLMCITVILSSPKTYNKYMAYFENCVFNIIKFNCCEGERCSVFAKPFNANTVWCILSNFQGYWIIFFKKNYCHLFSNWGIWQVFSSENFKYASSLAPRKPCSQ